MRYSSRGNYGFTLIELMVTVAIAGIVMTIGIPSFNSTITNSRMTTYANELITALSVAKSEAVKRGVHVTVRQKGAISGQWRDGWEVFVDSDGNDTFSDNGNADKCETNADGFPKEDCLLRTFDDLASSFSLVTSQEYLSYKATGMSVGGVALNFNLCQGADMTYSRKIDINAVGRANVSTPAVSC